MCIERFICDLQRKTIDMYKKIVNIENENLMNMFHWKRKQKNFIIKTIPMRYLQLIFFDDSLHGRIFSPLKTVAYKFSIIKHLNAQITCV